MFWQNRMQSEWVSFYINSYLPEILDPRFNRNLLIREPQEKKNQKRILITLSQPQILKTNLHGRRL